MAIPIKKPDFIHYVAGADAGRQALAKKVLRAAGVHAGSSSSSQRKAVGVLRSVHKGSERIKGMSESESEHFREKNKHLIRRAEGRLVTDKTASRDAGTVVSHYHADITRQEKTAEAEAEKRRQANVKMIRSIREREDDRTSGTGPRTSALRQKTEVSSALRNTRAKSSAAQVASARTSIGRPAPKPATPATSPEVPRKMGDMVID